MTQYTYVPNPRLRAALADTEKANAALALQTAKFREANDALEQGLYRKTLHVTLKNRDGKTREFLHPHRGPF